MPDEIVIGIDTSNYTTSVAAVSRDGDVISDRRRLLRVPEGMKGLRQQEAVFQHIENLPVLFSELKKDIGSAPVSAVSVSTRPRPKDGSYMPAFVPGTSFARTIGELTGATVFETSHQEGHVEAAGIGTDIPDDSVFFHLSGGTLEAVSVKDNEILGETLDISFGQLIDRTGVRLGIPFPCGKKLDELASSAGESSFVLPGVRIEDGRFNLSGIENSLMKEIDAGKSDADVARSLFTFIARTLMKMMDDIYERTGSSSFLLGGGVSSSLTLREMLENSRSSDYMITFGDPRLCSDNAVGVAMIGRSGKWHLNR